MTRMHDIALQCLRLSIQTGVTSLYNLLYPLTDGQMYIGLFNVGLIQVSQTYSLKCTNFFTNVTHTYYYYCSGYAISDLWISILDIAYLMAIYRQTL